jgi:alkylhydroperoxidase family enzyme
MLGRSVGLTDEKIAHLGHDPLPEGIYDPIEGAIIRYAYASTLLRPITDEIYGDLARYFDVPQIIELCMTVGLSNAVNRFHATFLTDLDEHVADEVGASCPLPIPPRPTAG